MQTARIPAAPHTARIAFTAAAPAPPRPPRARARRLRVSAGVTDQTARVRGDPERVCFLVSDVASWTAWSPITKKADKRGPPAEPIQVGTRFELQQELFGVYSFTMLYQVVELEPGKKLALSGLSDHFTSVDQFIFMPDVHDPNMTVVRYVSDIKLLQWKSALQPVVSKLLARVPGESLASLQKLLNSSRSPLYTQEFTDSYSAFARANPSKSARGAGRGSARSKEAGASGGWGGAWGGGGGGGWSFDGLFGGRGSGDGGAATRVSGRAAAATAAPPTSPDPSGHYAALGLRVTSSSVPPDDDDIRSAYRKLVMQLHPDRQAGKAPAAQRQAEDEFKRVLRAYEVLRDPESRRLYDSGQLLEDEEGAEI